MNSGVEKQSVAGVNQERDAIRNFQRTQILRSKSRFIDSFHSEARPDFFHFRSVSSASEDYILSSTDSAGMLECSCRLCDASPCGNLF